MDNNSLSHTKWTCKYHIVICTKVQKKGYIQANKSRYRSHIE